MDDTQTSVKYYKVRVPKDWAHYVIDPVTFEEIFVKLYVRTINSAVPDLRYKDLPPYMIHPTDGIFFMFEDEMEALTFKLTYL
jgi:hypothetical protein